VGDALQPRLEAVAEAEHHLVLALLDALHVDVDRAGDLDAELGGAARHVRDAGAGDEGLGGDAAVIHAGAADVPPLDDRRATAGAGQARRQRRPGLARAHDDRIDFAHGDSPYARFRRREPQVAAGRPSLDSWALPALTCRHVAK